MAECYKVAKSMKGKKNTDSSGSDIFNRMKVKKKYVGCKKKRERKSKQSMLGIKKRESKSKQSMLGIKKKEKER